MTGCLDNRQSDTFDLKVRWVIPQNVDCATFIGRDVFAIAHDIYIIFFNFRTNTELVYVADSEETGDGVDVIAGHKTNTFAFAEKVNHGRIFIMNYPTFNIVAELKDANVNRYKGLCMMECELVAGFSGFPNYLVTVWNWRTQQQLLSVPTGVVHRKQIYMASRTHLLICECWGEGLAVWEVALAYKRSLMMKRATAAVPSASAAEPAPPLVAVAWGSEGQLYALDPGANLYSLLSDGIGMVTSLEWSEDLKGPYKPCMCAFGSGLLISGPDDYIRCVRKSAQKWQVVWSQRVGEEVVTLAASGGGEAAAAWARGGRGYRLAGVAEDSLRLDAFTYKQRFIKNIQLVAPDHKYVITMNDSGMLCVYDVLTADLVSVSHVSGDELVAAASPAAPTLAVAGRAAAGGHYGVALVAVAVGAGGALRRASGASLTPQPLTAAAWSADGRRLAALAPAAGQVMLLKVTAERRVSVVRCVELGRALAACCLAAAGGALRCLCLVLCSDTYAVGERILCINAENGKDNKLTGKLQGPYSQLVPLGRDCVLAVPHLSAGYHLLQLRADKGVTVSVKVVAVVETGHQLRQYRALCDPHQLLVTFGFDGAVILHHQEPQPIAERVQVSHRYSGGVRAAAAGPCGPRRVLAAAGAAVACCVAGAGAGAGVGAEGALEPLAPRPPPEHYFDEAMAPIHLFDPTDKNYFDLQEEEKVCEEAADYESSRAEVERGLARVRGRVLALLDRSLAAPPHHRLPLGEFLLHLDYRRERRAQGERSREELRLQTEARMRAQDTVAAWLVERCWRGARRPAAELHALAAPHQVENYAILEGEESAAEGALQQARALLALQAAGSEPALRPWRRWRHHPAIESRESRAVASSQAAAASSLSMRETRRSLSVSAGEAGEAGEARDVGEAGSDGSGEAGETGEAERGALAASRRARYGGGPRDALPQLAAYSFLHMHWLQLFTKQNVLHMRLWFNQQFDELMAQKKREVGLVQERNARLRFIVEELNKLSDLRGSFHHLSVEIRDPEWRQEEQPERLIKVEPEECSVAPYVSPSQRALPAAAGGPRDDFRERALLRMMDGVLEKLWHEEIKKPVPMPHCMLEKDPEHFNEEDLRQVFEYEARVRERNEERDKYRKLLHAEYGRLARQLAGGVTAFDQRVKELWLTRLQVDSVIGQENLNLMRLRRTNLDRIEIAEEIEEIRSEMDALSQRSAELSGQLALAAAQAGASRAALDAAAARDLHLDRAFRAHFADLPPVVGDQCYKFFKRRPKWQQRGCSTGGALAELAALVAAAAGGAAPPPSTLLPQDCLDYLRGVEQLDMTSNMPPVMDEGLWTTMCRLRRGKIENEIRMRGLVVEQSYAESAVAGWQRALHAAAARRARLADRLRQRRAAAAALPARRALQLVLPAGQVEIVTTGHMEDFEDATLILKEDVEKINNVILKVGEMKLKMMRQQMDFRKGIIAKEWEHAQMRMKLRHMEQELHSYQRLKIPKELQQYLKNKELGQSEEQEHVRLEREAAGGRAAAQRALHDHVRRYQLLQVKEAGVAARAAGLERAIAASLARASRRRLRPPLPAAAATQRALRRMRAVVCRGRLVRAAQAQRARLALLHAELDLLRLRTYPTLATFHTVH